MHQEAPHLLRPALLAAPPEPQSSPEPPSSTTATFAQLVTLVPTAQPSAEAATEQTTVPDKLTRATPAWTALPSPPDSSSISAVQSRTSLPLSWQGPVPTPQPTACCSSHRFRTLLGSWAVLLPLSQLLPASLPAWMTAKLTTTASTSHSTTLPAPISAARGQHLTLPVSLRESPNCLVLGLTHRHCMLQCAFKGLLN